MSIEKLRNALHDIADDVRPVPEMASVALRRSGRRRMAARTAVAAGAAMAVTVPAVFGLLRWTGDDTGSAPAVVPASSPSAGSALPQDVEPAPPVRELSGAELTEAFHTCKNGSGGGYDGWKPVTGLKFDVDAEPGVATTWVIARRGDQWQANCAIDSEGVQVGGGGEYGVKATPGLLYAIVDGQEGNGVGRYTAPVASVTYQVGDGTEKQAATLAGFWFYIEKSRWQSIDGGRPESSPSEIDELDNGQIGVSPGYRFRGYDASGELVFDSETDGPWISDCFANPDGTFASLSDGEDTADCIQMIPWQPMP